MKEIIVFSLFQAVAIGVAYFLWVQILPWIPEGAWDADSHSEGISQWDLILVAWSLLCIGLATFFLGIFSGCIGAVHFLHRRAQESTIARCLKIVSQQGWRLWVFHWIDGIFTCRQILNRLPKKDDDTTPAQRALSEALYYAWKTGSIGFLPGLVMGKTLLEAGKDSLSLVKNRFVDIALLRAGYSAVCWVIGIIAYIGGGYFLYQAGFVSHDSSQPVGVQVYRFLLGAGIPIVFSVTMTQVFIRPVFVISLCDLYSDFGRDRGDQIERHDS